MEYDSTRCCCQRSRGGFLWILVGRITGGQIIAPANRARLYESYMSGYMSGYMSEDEYERNLPHSHVRSCSTIFMLPAFVFGLR